MGWNGPERSCEQDQTFDGVWDGVGPSDPADHVRKKFFRIGLI